ncbi:fungal-specific transcription factor domain-containing protein [Aspergillus cavernicola]|uniref:Fungal-specific transcription factor domain-containing protein n=1 Tax=Aspergillus cavernicola TaxID=176166 RepID=A0ABR4ITZ6_9EURO
MCRVPFELESRRIVMQEANEEIERGTTVPVNRESGQPSKKIRKTTNGLNGYRRQRNLKNLMMVNRLETNIGRLEAHLQDLGFDINNMDIAQTSPQLAESDHVQSPPPSPSLSDCGNSRHEGSWGCELEPGNLYTGSRTSHAAPFTDIHRDPAVPDTFDNKEGPFTSDFGGFLIPRCLLDTQNAQSFPVLSHEGLEWMSQKSGETPRLSSGYHSNTTTSFEPLVGAFPGKVFCPLPSKEEASSLLYEYLQNFNSLCPLFEQAKITSLFNHGSLEVALQDPPCWASANVVLALGIAYRTKDGSVAPTEHQKSWLFIKNALSVFHDLCLGKPNLWSIQALLGMSIFFLGTMSAEPCSFLATAAIRMNHQIGLRGMEEGVVLSAEEMEHRRNLFWIAYCLDREISLRFGKPPAQSDDDVSVGLPTASITDNPRFLPIMDRLGGFNAFRAQCQLATIKGQLYKDLYSTTAKDRPLTEIMTSIGTLDEMLQNWKEELPAECQPEAQLPTFPPSSISVMLLFLHCSYFNCLIAMHRLIASRGIRTAEDLAKKEDINISTPLAHTSRLFMSASLCANAARASIRLMRYMPEGHISLVGILIHYPIVALTALSCTIIRNPVDVSRLTDMKLINQVEMFLYSLAVSRMSLSRG